MFALMLACMAIALRLVVPQGYMVGAATEPGSFPIVLCTSQGVETVSIDAAGHVVQSGSTPPSDHPGGTKTDHPCVFSGFGVGLAVDIPMSVATADWRWAQQPLAGDPVESPRRGLAAPPPPATGPPLQI